jgi:hypothetical protein
LVFRFILNLSHNSHFRLAFVKAGFLGKLVGLFDSEHSKYAISILYQLSIDDKSRSNPGFGECIPYLKKTIFECKSEKVPIEIMALAINISTVPKHASMICGDNGLKYLFKRAIKTKDALIFKMLRILSQQDASIKMLFLDYVDDLMNLILRNDTAADILVECLGLLAQLTINEFDYTRLAQSYEIIPFLCKLLSDSKSSIAENDDIKLEAVLLIGTMLIDDSILPIMTQFNVPLLLLDFMVAKEEDDELILQVLYCVNRFLYHEPTKKFLVEKTDLVAYLVDLLYDQNIEIRKMCDASLDIIAEMDENWVSRIRQQKFQWHNSEWLQMIAQSSELSTGPVTPTPMENRLDRKAKRAIDKEIMSEEDEEQERLLIGGNSALLEGP